MSKRVNLVTLNKLKLLHCYTLILHFILHITTWRSCSYREAHFLISLMKILFVAEKEKRGLLKTRSAYAYCHNFTKKCNAKHIIWLMCFWKWKWYQTLVGFDYSFFNDVHRLKFNLSYRNMLFRIFSEQEMISKGYPSYTTSAGWLGYTDSQLRELCQKYLKAGWTRFVQVRHLWSSSCL